MAADGPASESKDLQTLEQRLEELNRKVDEVNSAQSSVKLTSRLVAVVIVIAAVIGVYMLISPFITAYKNKEVYTAAMGEQFNDRIIPVLEEELQATLQVAGPEVADLVWKRLESRQEDIVKAIDLESGAFVQEVQAHLEDSLADNVVEVELYIRARLNEMVPELSDPDVRDVVLANGIGAVEAAVRMAVTDRLEGHIQTLGDIETEMLAFEVPETLDQMSDMELSEELNRALAEYAVLVLRRSFSPGTKEMLRELSD